MKLYHGKIRRRRRGRHARVTLHTILLSKGAGGRGGGVINRVWSLIPTDYLGATIVLAIRTLTKFATITHMPTQVCILLYLGINQAEAFPPVLYTHHWMLICYHHSLQTTSTAVLNLVVFLLRWALWTGWICCLVFSQRTQCYFLSVAFRKM